MTSVVRVFTLGMLVLLVAPAASAGILLDPPMVPPSPPMNVHVSEGTDGVTITWDAPLSNGGASEVTYRVYKDSSLIADGVTTTAYVDSLPPGDSAAQTSYQVTAVNDAGESMQANGECLVLGPPFIDVGNCGAFAWYVVNWVLDQL